MRDQSELLFYDGDLFETLEARFSKIDPAVDEISKTQFLSTDDDRIIEHLASQMELQPIELHEDAKVMEQKETEVDVRGRFDYVTFDDGRPCEIPGLRITVSIPYTGISELWYLKPNSWQTTFPRGKVRLPRENEPGYLDITIEEPSNTDPETYKKILENNLQGIRFYLQIQKTQIDQKNMELPDKLRQAIAKRRKRLEKHDSVVQALNIPLKPRDGAPDISQIPIKRKLVRPLPPAPNKPPEPGITRKDYEYILSAIRHVGRSFEATPKTFAKHDEEELRDIILANLNGYLQGEATGETFRRHGKTDIQSEDNKRAAFVAECKVWYGPKELSETVDQLLGYLTWRDCKAAILIFNKDVSGFSAIQAKVPETLEGHSKIIRQIEAKDSGEWRYRFRSADDEDRKIIIHVFLFNLYIQD